MAGGNGVSSAGCGCCGQQPGTRAGIDRLVFYSLVCDEARRAEHAVQFELSVSSLRATSGTIPVVLFVHGPLAPEIARLCSRHGVMVAMQGAYRDRLAALCPRGADALARYPVLHKSLNFAELAAAGVCQALCCDLDTIFRRDVAHLFDRYRGDDVVAREEALSARSPHGADPTFIDEALLARIAAHLGRRATPPFNLGVVLYNNGVVARLAAIMPTFVDDVWRLITGVAFDDSRAEPAWVEHSSPWLAATRAIARRDDVERALPFPSSNGWIAEEVAWWLALGAVPGLSYGDFSPHDVAQNGEVLGTPLDRSPWTLCHYYSHNLAQVTEWLRAGLPTRPLDRGVNNSNNNMTQRVPAGARES